MVKTKALSCAYVFAYAKSRFSHDTADIQAARKLSIVQIDQQFLKVGQSVSVVSIIVI